MLTWSLMKGSDHPSVPRMKESNVINLQKVALCVVIEHHSSPLNKITLHVPLELRFDCYDI